jgi:protein SCO1/2
MMTKLRVFSLLIALLSPALLLSAKEVQAQSKGKYKTSVERYVIPDVMLVNQNGEKVNLATVLKSRKVALIDFFYTTCPTVCPVTTAIIFNFQNKLGLESDNVQIVSVTVDSENDTPERVKEYLKRYNAKPDWQGLTGPRDQISKAAKALDAFTVEKMAILPLVQLYSPGDNQWVRISGFIGTSSLIAEYKKVLKQ